jgi:hypothetical protein
MPYLPVSLKLVRYGPTWRRTRRSATPLPAPAGMDPSCTPTRAGCTSAPRTRGDGPDNHRLALEKLHCSPREGG